MSSPPSPVGALVLASVRLWWRKVSGRLGPLPTLVLALLPVGALVLFWAWMWPQAQDTVGALVGADPALDGVVVVTLLLGFAMVAAVLRVILLAFDNLTRDLRLLLRLAPLTATQAAAVRVLPDLLTSLVLSATLGSVGLVAFALVEPAVTLAEVGLWMVAVTALVGALAAVFEYGLHRLVRDDMAARAGAALGVLAVLCLVLALVIRSVAGNPGTSSAATLGRFLLDLGWAWSVLGAGALAFGACAAWAWAGAGVVADIFRGARRRPLLRVSGRSVTLAAAASFARDPANRLGLLSFAVLVGVGVWVEAATGFGVAAAIGLWGGVAVTCAAAVLVFGDYRRLRWRAIVAPSDAGLVFLRWFAGHVLTAFGVSAYLVALVLLARPTTIALWGATEFSWVATGLLLGIGAGAVAGRLVPADKDDVFTLAGSGVLAGALAAAVGWLLAQLDGGWPLRVVLAAGWCAVCLGGVVVVERLASVPGRMSPSVPVAAIR